MFTLLSGFFLLATVEVLGIDRHYEILKKYNCWNKADLFLDRAILFSYDDAFLNSWPGYNRFDCQMNIYSRTKTTGIIATVQSMKFRRNKADACVDYVKFNRDESQRCGDMLFGLRLQNNGSLWQPSKFVSEYSGPFTANANWPESKQLLSPGASIQSEKTLTVYNRVDEKEFQPGEHLVFTIAFTGFKECDGFDVPKGLFNCGYGVCILDVFVGDGVVNCPFGDCRDEGDCEEAKLSSSLFQNENDTTEYGTLDPANSSQASALQEKTKKCIQKALGGVMRTQDETKIVEQIESIGDEFKKHNTILEGISQFIQLIASAKKKEDPKE